jgi:hypothetical protein
MLTGIFEDSGEAVLAKNLSSEESILVHRSDVISCKLWYNNSKKPNAMTKWIKLGRNLGWGYLNPNHNMHIFVSHLSP